MPIIDQITMTHPIGFYDNFGNSVEIWLHWDGLGNKYKISKKGQLKLQESALKTTPVILNILKGLSYILLLPLTLSCLVFREVRRVRHLLPIIHGLKERAFAGQGSGNLKSNSLNNIQGTESDLQISKQIKSRDYAIKDYCLVRIGNQRYWIRSHEDENRFIAELNSLTRNQNAAVQVNLILGEPERLLGKLALRFKWSHPTGINGKIKRNVVSVQRFM